MPHYAQRRTSIQLLMILVLIMPLALLPARPVAGTPTVANEVNWQSIGPWGGRVDAVAFSPNYANDQTLFAATGGGLYRSQDGAQSWDLAGLANVPVFAGLGINDVAVSPSYANDRTLLVGTWQGVFRSLDGGATWVSTSDAFNAAALAFSPDFVTDRTAVFVGSDGVFRSTNGGSSWSRVTTGLANCVYRDVVISPNFASDGSLFVACGKIYRSNDRGTSWSVLSFGQDLGAFSLAISPTFATDQTLFAAGSGSGPYRSTDGGRTWEVRYDLPGSFSDNIAISPNFAVDRTLLVAANGKLFRSRNAGNSWQPLELSIGNIDDGEGQAAFAPNYATSPVIVAASRNTNGIILSNDSGDTWTPSNQGLAALDIHALAASPDFTNDGIMLAGAGINLYRTNDRGVSWQQVLQGFVFGYNSLAFSPDFANDRTVYATSSGLLRSSDGGLTWQGVDTPPFPNSAGTAGRVEPSTTFASAVNWVVLSPGYRQDRTIYVSVSDYVGNQSGVYVSNNAGGNWRRLTTDTRVKNASILAVSPTYTADNTLLAGVWSEGIYRSTNGGGGWARVQGFPDGFTDGSVGVLVFSPDFANDQTAFAALGDQVYRSTDGGINWSQVATGPAYANAIAFSPNYASDRTVYLGTAAPIIATGDVYRSTDNGASWAPFTPALDRGRIRTLATVGSEPQLFAGTDSGVYRLSETPAQASSVSGTIRNQRGELLNDVEVTITPVDQREEPRVLRTVDGVYGVTNLIAGKAYIVRPRQADYYFDPPSGVIASANGQITFDFTGTIGRRPLIFLHGVLGSSLDIYSTNGLRMTEVFPSRIQPFTANDLALDLNSNSFRNIKANAPIWNVLGRDVYGDMISMLTNGANGFVEYKIDGDPARRTLAGCQYEEQRNNNPTLFVFAYDWRLSNEVNAARLDEYVQCIRKFYGASARVNLLTHSMGGLVARRFIIEHPDAVDQVMNVAPPFVGAPQAISSILFGELLWWGGIGATTYKDLVENFPGPHELLPSRAYFELNEFVFNETEWDANENGRYDGWYTYGQLVNMFSVQKDRSLPGANNVIFHNYRGGPLNLSQDVWSDELTGIEYIHVAGLQSRDATPGSYQAAFNGVCATSLLDGTKTCVGFPDLQATYTSGDGTVPIVSALRSNGVKDLNAPAATTIVCTPRAGWFGRDDNDWVKHAFLMHNTDIQAIAAAFFRGRELPLEGNCRKFRRGEAAPPPLAVENASAPAFYLRLTNTEAVTISNSFGETITFGDEPSGYMRGVDSLNLGSIVQEFILTPGPTYSVTVQIGDGPIALDLTRGTGASRDLARRYRDLDLPAGTLATLVIDADEPLDLRYDSVGDGIADKIIDPAADLIGSAADDRSGPEIAVQVTGPLNAQQVTLTATDAGSGVKRLYYSLNGTTFVPYTAPLTINSLKHSVIYAFADDQAANRSSIITITLSQSVYLPLIQR
ncbi:hypothetical protein EYB53_023705 [Candidatus Chloroploca sp. M-50]|uniref:Uncharacterized protein n=1 Tax=Candidatus Chloroploca mongolica TaxID=2528176 RepID=A0ABS4DH20_9CHLR|nr:YCF48-related protein [Candidatus Chloroploca mongolica]MBP1468741.1 hypothetical protein [Candidatus Chloroploca mongolica]